MGWLLCVQEGNAVLEDRIAEMELAVKRARGEQEAAAESAKRAAQACKAAQLEACCMLPAWH
jgi:hypothetical protein